MFNTVSFENVFEFESVLDNLKRSPLSSERVLMVELMGE